MRDGIVFARAGLPSVALVTEEFTEEADFIARAAGMPEVPRLHLPHPVAGSDSAAMTALSEKLAPRIRALLAGER